MASNPSLIDQHVELHEYLIAERAISAKLQAEVDQLTAQASTLREALKAWNAAIEFDGADSEEFSSARNDALDAIAATPAESLESYWRKVLDEAVESVRKQSEVYSEFQNENAVLMAAAEVIRRMAGEE